MITRSLAAALAAGLVLPLLPAQTSPEQSRLQMDSLLAGFSSGHSIRQLALAPDGKHLAWVGEDGIRLAAIAEPGKSLRVTVAQPGQNCQEGDPIWAPDSKALAFFSNCGDTAGQSELYLVPAIGGKPIRLTTLHGYVAAPAFSSDGSRIGFLYIEGASRPAGALAAMNAPVGVIGEEGVDVQRVAAVEVNAGAPHAPSFLTPALLYVYEFDWAPDARALAYVAAPPPGENNWWVARLFTQPLGGEPRALVAPAEAGSPLHGLQLAVPRWSPDGKSIAFVGGLMSDQGSTGGDIWVASVASGEPVNLTPGRKATPTWFEWTTDASLMVSELASGMSRVVRMRLNRFAGQGSLTVLGELTDFTLPASIGDGRLEMSLSTDLQSRVRGWHEAFIRSDSEHAPEIYLYDSSLESERAPSRLRQWSHFNDGVTPAWGKSLSLTWTSGGNDVQGWLMLPKDYDPAKKYPLIVNVHGGPGAAAQPHWQRGVGLTPAIFSALGYFVLQPNPRGSFGQGEAFVQANRKDFGHGDLTDILAGVDAVTARYPVDPERVGLMGWSYGGFMSMFAVTQTSRFKAAVAGAGIANWQSYYGQNSIDQWMTPYFGASVYDDPAVYRNSSAIEFIKQAKTPTLVVVGERDGECPPAQSFEFWHALNAQGVPTRLVVYPGEGHRFASAAHQRDVVERAADWFARYLPAH